MSSLDKAVETQLKNIETKTGKTRAELSALVKNSGLEKHGQIRQMLMDKLGLGHGDANALAHFALNSDGTRAAQAKGLTGDAVLDEIYSGKKTDLRPIHDKLMAAINAFGAFEIAPKKGYISLRRKKQFAMIGPAAGRVDVGLNIKTLAAHPRLTVLPAGGMCNVNARVTDVNEVDAELIGWIKQAYDSAG